MEDHDNPDPEDDHARADAAFERADSYSFNDVALAFSYEHEAASARLGFSFGPGDVADFLYLLTLPGERAARIRSQAQKDAFFADAGQWGKAQGIRIGTQTLQRALDLTTQILQDWQASRADPIPDPNETPTKN